MNARKYEQMAAEEQLRFLYVREKAKRKGFNVWKKTFGACVGDEYQVTSLGGYKPSFERRPENVIDGIDGIEKVVDDLQPINGF